MDPRPTLALDQKIAIVTGGANGLGAAMADVFVRAGAAVVIADRDAEGTMATVARLSRRGSVTGHVTDVARPSFGDEVVASAIEAFGGVDIVVNNAAIYPSKRWDEYSIEDFDEVLRVNLRALFVLAKAAVPLMTQRGGGSIINIGSLTFIAGFERILPYVTSKGGVVGFTRALAREVGANNIRVNTVSPGAFPTGAESIHPNRDEYSRFVIDRQALKFRGTPEDLANVVLFLASDSSRFVTGQTIGVDGGWVHT